MGALANSVALRASAEWRAWLVAAAAYQARLVVLEAEGTPEHAIRLRLAREVAYNPEMIADMLVSIISSDPAVATAGATPTAVTEALVLSKMAEVWTTVARLVYQQDVVTG